MNGKKRYRFGIVGGGAISRIHGKALQQIQKAEIAGVYDPDCASAAEFTQQFGGKAYSSFEQLLQDSSIDVINICTPSGTHANLTIQAAQAGKHVVVEKPMGIRKNELDEVVRVQQQTGVQISVISQLRFSPAVQQAREAVQQGLLGKLVLASLSMRYHRDEEYYSQSSWRGTWESDGGGALMNQGIHGLDLLCYICGRVSSVQAVGKTMHHTIEVEDTLAALLEFENGAIATLEASTAIQPGQPRRIEIGGTKGSLALTEDAITQWQVKNKSLQQHKASDMDAANDPGALDIQGHAMQFQNLIAAVEAEQPLLIDSKAGRETVNVILAIYESMNSGEKIHIKRDYIS